MSLNKSLICLYLSESISVLRIPIDEKSEVVSIDFKIDGENPDMRQVPLSSTETG